jgi:hypothetical protein
MGLAEAVSDDDLTVRNAPALHRSSLHGLYESLDQPALQFRRDWLLVEFESEIV